MPSVKYPAVMALFRAWALMPRTERSALKETLAAAAGVDYSIVTRWMNGSVRPTPERYEAIAGILEVSSEDVAAACSGATQRDDDPTVVRLALQVERLAARVDELQDLVDEQKRAIAWLRSNRRVE